MAIANVILDGYTLGAGGQLIPTHGYTPGALPYLSGRFRARDVSTIRRTRSQSRTRARDRSLVYRAEAH